LFLSVVLLEIVLRFLVMLRKSVVMFASLEQYNHGNPQIPQKAPALDALIVVMTSEFRMIL